MQWNQKYSKKSEACSSKGGEKGTVWKLLFEMIEINVRIFILNV